MNFQQFSDKISDTGHGFYSSHISENISYTENGHQLIPSSEENSFWFDHRTDAFLDVCDPLIFQIFLISGEGTDNYFFFSKKIALSRH